MTKKAALGLNLRTPKSNSVTWDQMSLGRTHKRQDTVAAPQKHTGDKCGREGNFPYTVLCTYSVVGSLHAKVQKTDPLLQNILHTGMKRSRH